MDKIHFSFIIPTLNEEDYLPKLLESIKEQKEKDFEVIIVDGGSKDNTQKFALEFQKDLNLKLFIHEKAQNVAAQRNFGASKAKGDYFVFIDSDYFVNFDFLNQVKNTIKETKANFVIPVSIPYPKHFFWNKYFYISNLLCPPTLNIKMPLAIASAVCVKKEEYKRAGGYDESVFVYEDQYFLQQAFRRGAKITYSKSAKVFFSIRRMQKYGMLTYFYQNITAFLHLMLKGPVRKKIYKYEMGGHEFTEEKK